ncbi:uncharacterized protein LOC103707769 isoform X2 [Phoenix dactylifera]|uniref:Uncharacterized protein LOC103707769 isoform X2 n=1 Tax=Phoenix dactylifera TaxID=42345 RepID=A0A8B7C312_PHODC|nr:uncharacterized protein LOC103707769 isoform X2 [Phoenix dactylifera]
MAGAGGGGAPGAMAASVVPTEDTIDALMSYLVAPLLPLRISLQEAPTDDQQEAVARQIHAVVLLYNYYHRKLFPQLEFLAFESFCKAASIAIPTLLTYLKYMHKYDDGSGDLHKQMSITEKKIMDACNISEALDASNNAPNMEGWPISKVAVFLINHMKERCLLQFGSLTQGVWSLLEQELVEPIDNQGGGTQMNKNESKNKRIASGCSDGSSENDYVLQQLAFSILEQKAGINHANCCILEHHLAYSLSQEKTTTRLYIMKYTETVSEELSEVNIKDVISSLRGPLVRKAFTPEVTPVVEHYNLLPYVDILSDWLKREALYDGSLHLPALHADVNKKCPLLSDRASIVEDPKTDNKSDWDEQTVDKMSNTKNETITKNTNSMSSKSGSIRAACRPKVNDHILSVEPDKSSTMEDEVVSESFQNEQTVDVLSHKSRIRTAVTNSVATDGPNMSGSFTLVCRPHNEAINSSLNQYQQPSVNEEDMWRENDILYSPTIKRKKNNIQDTDVTLHGCNEKASMADSAEPCTTKGIYRELLGKPDTGDSVQCGKATFDLPLVPLQVNMENQDAFQLVTSKKDDLLQASLLVLQKRRDDLCQQQRLLEDEIARCEMNIQTILSEGEENSKPKVESILAACNALCSSQMHVATSLCSKGGQTQKIKRKRLVEAVLKLQSSCQELDDICCENSWILPRYSVLPSISDGSRPVLQLKGWTLNARLMVI